MRTPKSKVTTQKVGPGRTDIMKDGIKVLVVQKNPKFKEQWGVIGRGRNPASLGEVKGRYTTYREAMKAARQMVGA